MPVVPSQLLGPLIPASLGDRWKTAVESRLEKADRIWAGTDEKAIDQRSSLVAFAIRVLSALIAFVGQVMLARWMGGYEYGIFVWVWVAVVIVGSLACFGFPSAVVRFIPEYRQGNEQNSLRGVIFGSRIFCIASASIIAFLGLAGLWFFEDQISSIYIAPIYLGIICLPMLALAEVQDGIARAFSWIGVALSPTFLVRPVLILAFFFLGLRFDFPPNATTALGAAIMATYLTTLFQLVLLNPRTKAKVERVPRRYHMAPWLTVAIPIFLVEGFFALLTNVDILIAGVFLSPERVAIYFATVKTLAIVHFVYFAVKAASAHRIAQHYHSGDDAKYRAVVHDTIQWTFWPSVLMAIIILLAGKYLLALFGTEFVEGQDLLVILVAGIIARASIGPAESVLTMSGKQNACALIYGLTLLANIFLNLLLIPIYGLHGAAFATLIALVGEAIALYLAAKHLLGLNIFVFASRSNTAKDT